MDLQTLAQLAAILSALVACGLFWIAYQNLQHNKQKPVGDK